MADSFPPLICGLFLGTHWVLVILHGSANPTDGSMSGAEPTARRTSLSSSLAQDTGLSRRQHGFESRRGRFAFSLRRNLRYMVREPIRVGETSGSFRGW